MSLYLEALPGESIVIGNGTRVVIEEKSGRKVRLRIDSTESVRLSKQDEEPQQSDGPPILRRPMRQLPQPPR